MPESRPFTLDRIFRYIMAATGICLAIWLVNILSNVLLPFCLACLISYILEPIVEFHIVKLRIRWRILAIFCTISEVTAAIVGLSYLFLPSIIHEIHQMATMIKDYSAHSIAIPFFTDELRASFEQYFNAETMQNLVQSQHFETLLTKSTAFISSSVELMVHTLEWFLTFIYIIFILLDYDRLMKGFGLLIPPKYRPIAQKIGSDIKYSMNRYFRGQAFLALCAAVLYCIGFSIVGIPLAIVLGLLVGILYMIPYFQYITLIPVAFVCFVSSLNGEVHFWALLGQCLIVYAVSQSICDYVLTPKVMGKALGLNPAIILLSLSVWGTLLGLIGMIIALPLTTLLLAYYQQYVIDRPTNNENSPFTS